MNQLEALNNACKYSGVKGLMAIEIMANKPNETAKFVVMFNGKSISPALSYDRLNHFILGIINFKKYIL